ncbi:unnamed protein product, partial [Aureobasidium vineae]
MAPTSDTTTSAQPSKNTKAKEQWKWNIWKQKTSEEKKSPEVFNVHRALLCFYSPYHDRLLNGIFVEGLVPPTEPLVVQANSSILELFYTWLYTGTIHLAKDPESCQWDFGMIKLYVFADELNCTALQRSIIPAQVGFSESLSSLAGFDCNALLSNSSLESSGLYRYHLDTFAEHWNGTTDGKSSDALAEDVLPRNFAYRLLLRKFDESSEDDEDCSCCHDPCAYHGHENEEERKATCEAPDDEAKTEEFDFETDTESESESIAGPNNRSAGEKRKHDDGETTTSEAKRVKTT